MPDGLAASRHHNKPALWNFGDRPFSFILPGNVNSLLLHTEQISIHTNYRQSDRHVTLRLWRFLSRITHFVILSKLLIWRLLRTVYSAAQLKTMNLNNRDPIETFLPLLLPRSSIHRLTWSLAFFCRQIIRYTHPRIQVVVNWVRKLLRTDRFSNREWSILW